MSQEQSSEETAGNRQATDAVGDEATPTADMVFGILSGATNRYILQYLIDCDRQVSVNELVEYVVTATGNDPGETVGEFRGSVRQSVEDSIAELESHGFLRYDRQSQAVQSTGRTYVAQPYLSLARKRLGRSK